MADAATDIRVERKPKLSERVVTALRSQVLSGEISPGHKLPTENQLTETFGVSRTVTPSRSSIRLRASSTKGPNSYK